MALEAIPHTSFDAPGLADDWARLSGISPRASIFTTYEWCRCWAETVGCGAVPAILLFKDAGGQARGLLPAYLDRTGPVRWLKFLGRERVSGEHLDLLCAPEDHLACLDALIRYVEGDRNCDGVVLGELERDGLTQARLRAWAAVRHLPLCEREPRILPYIALPPTYDEYLATLPKKMRYNVRHSRDLFERTPDAALRLLREPAEVDAALDDFFHLHAQRWQRAGHTGNYQYPPKRDFLRRFCHLAAARDWVRCHVLELGRQRQSMLLAFFWGPTASFYQGGWNPDGGIVGPGVTLIAESIAQAIGERLRTYDFLRGDEAYKRKWGTQFVRQTTLVIARRAPARAMLTAERFASGVKTTVHRTLGDANWQRVRRLVGALTR